MKTVVYWPQGDQVVVCAQCNLFFAWFQGSSSMYWLVVFTAHCCCGLAHTPWQSPAASSQHSALWAELTSLLHCHAVTGASRLWEFTLSLFLCRLLSLASALTLLVSPLSTLPGRSYSTPALQRTQPRYSVTWLTSTRGMHVGMYFSYLQQYLHTK